MAEGNGIFGAFSSVFNTVKNVAKDTVDETKKATKSISELGAVADIVSGNLNMMVNSLKPFTEVQSAVVNLTKQMGLSADNIAALTNRTIARNKELSISANYGISNQQLFDLRRVISSQLGRNVAFNEYNTTPGFNPDFDTEIANIAAAMRLMGPENAGVMLTQLNKFGISFKSAAKMTKGLFDDAGKYGVNLEKYARNFLENIEMAQNYTFRNGVKGLQEMARKATEIRQDMRQVASFAEKVGTVTGAVETAARLQVLGGSFTQMANPLAMLNESLTNMEGLQDRLINMTKGTARYNTRTHQIDMDPVTRLRLKEAAQAAGLDASNLIDQAYAQARGEEIKRQMTGLALSDDMRKLITNIGTIDSDTGQAGAMVEGKFRSVAELAQNRDNLQEKLIAENKSTGEDVKDISKHVQGIEDRLAAFGMQLRNEIAANQIKPGMVSGISMVEAFSSALLNSTNPEVIQGLGKAYYAESTPYATFFPMAVNAGADLANVFSSENFSEVQDKLKEFMNRNFPDTPIFKGLQTAASGLASVIEKVTTGFSEILQGEGIDFDYNRTFADVSTYTKDKLTQWVDNLPSSENMASAMANAMLDRRMPIAKAPATEIMNTTGVKPVETITAPREGNEATEDVKKEAAARKKEEPIVLTPTAGSAFNTVYTQPQANTVVLTETDRPFTSPTVEHDNSPRRDNDDRKYLYQGSSNNAPQISQGQDYTPPTIEITTSEKSIPGASVEKAQTTSRYTENEGGNNGQAATLLKDVNINLSGNITVNGERGVLTRDDLLKLFSNEGFKQEFLNMLGLEIRQNQLSPLKGKHE